jgi:hypothetical protein
VILVWHHPPNTPLWTIYGALMCQILAVVLTALLWGRWQAQLAIDPRGSGSPYLGKIIRTHWIRTLLISVYAGLLLIAAGAAWGR